MDLAEGETPGGVMGREIICNNVNLLVFGKAGDDLFKESNKLRTGATRGGLAQHLAGFGALAAMSNCTSLPAIPTGACWL
jgi:hypothetical protein